MINKIHLYKQFVSHNKSMKFSKSQNNFKYIYNVLTVVFL